MSPLKTAKIGQNQIGQLAPPNTFNPDFSHHLYPCSDSCADLCYFETINHMTLRANGISSLIRKSFTEDSSSSLNYDDIYYSITTVKMIVDDISAVNCAYRAATEGDGQDQTQADNPVLSAGLSPLLIDHNIFSAIDKMVFRAGGVLSLLCNQFAGDEMGSNKEQLTGAIDSVTQELANIEAIAIGSRKATDNQQV